MAAPKVFIIEDEVHCEWCGRFSSFRQALDELKRLSAIAWDQSPNAAPCTSSATCGREYVVVEYDDSQTPWHEIKRTAALNIAALGVEWLVNPDDSDFG